MSLKQQLAASKPDCYDIDSSARSFIEFQPTPETRQGFALAQLLHYTVEANPEGDKDAPERLTLAFSTADVVVTGSRLAHLADLLRDHKLAALRTLPERYGNLEPNQSWIASIAINRLDKPGGAAG
jgi:hypothetical protein